MGIKPYSSVDQSVGQVLYRLSYLDLYPHERDGEKCFVTVTLLREHPNIPNRMMMNHIFGQSIMPVEARQ
jgi:hypothetical protein